MVAAVGRGVEGPVVATGVLVTGAPIGIAPAGSSDGRDQLPVCDETPQITMGFPLSGKRCPTLDVAAENDEVLGGHPEDFKPEQPGVN